MYSVYRNSVLNKHFSMENVVYSDFIIIIDIHNITCTCHVHVLTTSSFTSFQIKSKSFLATLSHYIENK